MQLHPLWIFLVRFCLSVDALQQLWDAGVYYEAGCEDEPYFFYLVAHETTCSNDDPCVNFRKICGVNKDQVIPQLVAAASHPYVQIDEFKQDDCTSTIPFDVEVVRADGQCYAMPTGASYMVTVNDNQTINYNHYVASQKDCKTPAMTTQATNSAQCVAYTTPTGSWSIISHIKLTLLSTAKNSSVTPRSALCCATSPSSSASAGTLTPSSTATPQPSLTPSTHLSTSKPSTDTTTGSGGTGTSSGTIIGILAGALAVVVVVGALLVWKKRSSKANRSEDHYLHLPPHVAADSNQSQVETSGTDGSYLPANASSKEIFDLLEDPHVVASRIPLKAIRFTKLLGSGAFGEVYVGAYMDQMVAIKRLLPAAKQDLARIKGFAKEIKLMATMHHKNIIGYIGVAWVAIQDLCVVEEYMNAGSLRDWLVTCKNTGRAKGFDREKLTIAIQIADGLTYLHTLTPRVLHRDLKSSNVLLNDQMETKLSDFGESRLGLEGPMTGEVGTTLWMAPEVIRHDQYDERADVYSFGMILTELDSHDLPFAQLQLGNMALMTKIAMNQIHASFSAEAQAQVVSLGMKCLAYEPSDRPSTAQASYELHCIMKEAFSK